MLKQHCQNQLARYNLPTAFASIFFLKHQRWGGGASRNSKLALDYALYRQGYPELQPAPGSTPPLLYSAYRKPPYHAVIGSQTPMQ